MTTTAIPTLTTASDLLAMVATFPTTLTVDASGRGIATASTGGHERPAVWLELATSRDQWSGGTSVTVALFMDGEQASVAHGWTEVVMAPDRAVRSDLAVATALRAVARAEPGW